MSNCQVTNMSPSPKEIFGSRTYCLAALPINTWDKGKMRVA